MDLWIRNQDKTKLVKVDKILIENSDIGNYEVGMLGTYKTKERALEVLDEINNLLIGNITESLIRTYEVFNGEKHKVYQMPEE